MSPALPHRRDVIAGAAALAVTPSLAAEPQALVFLATADFGRDGLFHQKDVAAAMARAADATKPAFILAVGDNVYPDGVTGVTDPKWRTSYEAVYSAPSLQRPWYAVLGNHDYHGDPQAQVEYTKTSNRWRMPARFYSVPMAAPDGTSVEVFGIDTSPMLQRYQEAGDDRMKVKDQDVAAQLAWLDRALAASPAQRKIVMGHHPVYSGGEHGDTPELIAMVLPILKRRGVKLYINGHDHDLQHIERDGMTFVCTGAGSKTRPSAATTGTVFHADRPGFTAYAVRASGVTIRFVDYEDKLLHVAEAT